MSDAPEKHPPRINCVLICGGVWHDMDFARLELLKLLAEDPRVRTRVFEDYENIAAIEQADMIITYTCDVTPSLKAQEALRSWLTKGGRWYALHGTNSVLRLLESGLWDAPRWAPLMMDMLGSQFISHPPIVPYLVKSLTRSIPWSKIFSPLKPRMSCIIWKPTAHFMCCLTRSAPNRAPVLSRPIRHRAHIRFFTLKIMARVLCCI
jgi:hypothetical protein